MTWEDAYRRYPPINNPQSVNPNEAAQLAGGRILSPRPATHTAMEIDSSAPAPAPSARSGSRQPRTPLPTGPRMERRLSGPAQPTASALSDVMELEAAALAMLASPHRVRYSKVVVHLFHWAKDEKRVIDAIQGLADTLRSEYQYMCKVQAIQASAEGCHWVLNEAIRVFDADDNREVMKIYYFGGHSYLKDGQMMISR